MQQGHILQRRYGSQIICGHFNKPKKYIFSTSNPVSTYYLVTITKKTGKSPRMDSVKRSNGHGKIRREAKESWNLGGSHHDPGAKAGTVHGTGQHLIRSYQYALRLNGIEIFLSNEQITLCVQYKIVHTYIIHGLAPSKFSTSMCSHFSVTKMPCHAKPINCLPHICLRMDAYRHSRCPGRQRRHGAEARASGRAG